MIEAAVALLVVLVVGGAYLAWRHRAERGIESGISSFRRELSALAPRREPGVLPGGDDPTATGPPSGGTADAGATADDTGDDARTDGPDDEPDR